MHATLSGGAVMWRIARALREPTDQERKHLGSVEPIYDPVWLRASYPRCLWDGGVKESAAEFCSEACAEAYDHWEFVQAEYDLRLRIEEEDSGAGDGNADDPDA